MARPKGSRSLASRLMGGLPGSAGIYQQAAEGRQVYIYATWRWREAGVGSLRIKYVGCGMQGRSQHHQRADQDPVFQQWLRERWVPRTVLFAKPRRLERLAWLEQVLTEYSCPEGLVVFETPFLKHALLVEGRLIEIYKELGHADFNISQGKRPQKQLRVQPNFGCLRPHAASIRARLQAGEAQEALAREFGVDPSSIRDIKTGRSYKDA